MQFSTKNVRVLGFFDFSETVVGQEWGPLRLLEGSVFSPLFGSLAELRSFARVIESGAAFVSRFL